MDKVKKLKKIAKQYERELQATYGEVVYVSLAYDGDEYSLYVFTNDPSIVDKLPTHYEELPIKVRGIPTAS